MKILAKYLLSSALRVPEGVDSPAPDAGLRETLAFDPSTFFAPKPEEGAGEGEGEGADAPDEGAGDPPPEPEAKDPPADPAQGEPAGEDDALKALRETVADFLKKPAPAPEQTQEERAPAKTEAAPKGEAAEFQGYNFSLNEAVVEALGSDDLTTRSRALNGVVNGLANKLAQDFGSAMKAMAADLEGRIVKTVQTQAQTQSSEAQVRADFYGAFPDLKELADSLPGMEHAIWTTVSAVARAKSQTSWTPELRDAAGQMIRVQLKLPQPGAAAKPQAKTPRKAPFNAGGGSGGRSGGADKSDEFLSVVNAGTT